MSPTGFDQQHSSHDLSPDSRLNLLIQQSQNMQREAMQAHGQVPHLPIADVAAHQGDQMPWETAGEWTPVSSMAQGIVSSTKEGPQSICHGKPLADMRADELAQLTCHTSAFPSSSSQLPTVAEQDPCGIEIHPCKFLLRQPHVLLNKMWFHQVPWEIHNK